MRTIRTFGVFFAALFLALGVYAQDPEPDPDPGFVVDEETQTITVKPDASIEYSAISSYGTDYTIELSEGSTLTHNAWVTNRLTGTGTYSLTATDDFVASTNVISNLSDFTGTLKLGETKVRLRDTATNPYSQLNPNMTIDISQNAQLWLNGDLGCKLYLHDVNGGYDGLGQLRFDWGGTHTITGPITISGGATISARVDNSTATEYITSAITGVHTADDSTKDSVTFNGNPGSASTEGTIILSASNYWNGTTTINQQNIELTGSGTLGAGTIYLSQPKKFGENSYSIPGTLTLNRTDDFTLPNIESPGTGGVSQTGGLIVKKNSNTVSIGTSEAGLRRFNGTVDIQGGTIETWAQTSAPDTSSTTTSTYSNEGGLILTGTGTFYVKCANNGVNFYMSRYDLSGFEGTFEIQQGRTFNTYAKYFGPDATVKVNDGASFMFYNNSAACGDYPSKFVIAGNGHSEGLGSIRFHVSLSADDQAKLNTATDVSLPNITGPVELASNTKIIARYSANPGWGAITGNISGGSYNLVLNDGSKGWMVLTGTNTWGESDINGTVQLGYVGSINGKTYDGTTGTLGSGKVTLNSGAVLDYRRVNEYALSQDIVNNGTIKVSSGTLAISKSPTGAGTIEVPEGSVLNVVNCALNTTNKITGTGTVNMSWTSDNVIQLDGFSDFAGTLNINSNKGRYRLDGKTVRFGSGRTIIGNTAQLYMNGSTFYGNFEFGESAAYDGTYPAALRSDGTGTSRIFGTVTLTDDGATICNRANNNGNVENGSKLVLYADVSGPGSLTKREDSAGNAGVLTFGTTTVDGTTYGGTVDYEGTTNVKTGILRVANGVTMYGQKTITVDSGAVMDFQNGSTLAVGPKNATTGTTLNVTGAGELRFNGDMALDIYSETDFDQLVFNGLNIVSDSAAQKKIRVNVSNSADLGDTLVPVVLGMSPETLADWVVSVSSGYGYVIQEDGTLLIGSANVVPEPSTIVLLILGFGLILLKRRS